MTEDSKETLVASGDVTDTAVSEPPRYAPETTVAPPDATTVTEPPSGTIADAETEIAANTAAPTEEAAEDAADGEGGEAVPPATESVGDADEPENPLARFASKRVAYQMLGTLLIVGGIAAIVLTLGITGWNTRQKDQETQQFLGRVSTPRAVSAITPFPSTVSGASVPNTERTPTANVATRAAQPVSTTNGGPNRTIIAAQPVAPTATPAATPAPNATAAPTPKPKPRMPLPTHLSIPSIRVESDVVQVGVSPVEVDGQQALIWDVAPYAVGHHFSSANPGEGENVVLSGHDDWQGEVFRNLYRVKQGDEVDVQAGDRTVKYTVDEILLLPEIGEPLEKRLANAAFIGTTGDERLTLVTCWPYGVDDHRLVVIARPAG